MAGKAQSENSDLQPLIGERCHEESNNAVLACNDFLRLGAGRKIVLLAQYYAQMRGQIPPTRSYGTLQAWSHKFGWTERGKIYDAQYDEYKTTLAEAALETGTALIWERVQRLKMLEEKLLDLVFGNEQENIEAKLFLEDWKQTGSGEFSELHRLERFNSSLVDQYRKVLSDLADETGGRKKASDRGSEDEPIVVKVFKGVSMEDL